MIKAIETIYNGYRFRSRIEARWAVFFDTLGIPYEYEKEGYDLEGTWYLPDFWLPELGCWVEIKGEQPTEAECLKAKLLASATQKSVFILWGNLEPFWYESIPLRTINESKQLFETTGEYHPVSDLKYHGVRGHRFSPRNGEVYWSDTFWMFTECRYCHKVEITFWGMANALTCGCVNRDDEKVKLWKEAFGEEWKRYFHDTPRLWTAYNAARQARFEHGEKG